jgi:nitroreductase / dihydropteridine reductase
MTFLENLQWRNATKDFDSEKKIPTETFENILEAIRMAPTSFGLQPFSVMIVKTPEMREHIKEVAWGQAQITDSDELLIFCSRNDIFKKRIDEFLAAISKGDSDLLEKFSEYAELMRGAFRGRSVDEQKVWADRQAYIALGFAMAAAAELQVDSCPIEGFDPQKVDSLLGLPENLRSVVILALGYRKADPTRPKFRFSAKDLFLEV